ncbi:hypothetical protein LWI28_026732 [Acer negundo]|uniref:Uncharacterized protein n=1 Tax=Acer negundo TaxID=4023 RepID=A0AAD5IHC1_ACENE|nr:hypothetical protein LWI28_026732 [Acer negundo]
MIKRRFYRVEHADGDGAEDSSSSSSDSELEGHTTEEESEDDVAVDELKQNDEACSTSSGYESEDSSADEVNVDSSSVLYETDDEIENDKEIAMDSPLSSKHGNEVTKINSRVDVSDCILQIKSVFRCRICPNVLCLTEEFLRAHLNSKRHARSEKLMKENKLKSILNSDGEIENQETPAELHARILALAEDKEEKKNNRRQRRRNISGKTEATSKENRSKSFLNSDDQIDKHTTIVALVEDKEEKKNNRRQRRRNISGKKEATSKENRSKSILNSDGQIEDHAPIVALVEDKEEKKNNRCHHRRNIPGKKEKLLEKSVMKKSREETRKPAKKKRDGARKEDYNLLYGVWLRASSPVRGGCMRQKGPRIRAFRNDRGSNRDDLVGGRPESLQPRPVRRSLGDDRNSGKTVESPPVVRSVLRVDVSLSNSRGEGVSHILG